MNVGVKVADVPHVILNNGVSIPQLGLGVFEIPFNDTQALVESALEAGYRHIDTAAAYGNEAAVGAAISASGIARDEIFVTTKLRNGQQSQAKEAFEASREALGVEVIDLYLIHWPVPSLGRYVDAWRSLEAIYHEGLARAIGVSNFLPDHIETLLASTTVVPAVNQFELHPTFQQAQLWETCRAHNIAVEAYSPLGRGADLDAATVRSLSNTYEVTPAQIVLAWQLAMGNIAIPKSANPRRARENLEAVEVSLSAADLAAIAALECGARTGGDPATIAFTQMPTR
jgi:2,5-diketo-D-gluconate reductase A